MTESILRYTNYSITDSYSTGNDHPVKRKKATHSSRLRVSLRNLTSQSLVDYQDGLPVMYLTQTVSDNYKIPAAGYIDTIVVHTVPNPGSQTIP